MADPLEGKTGTVKNPQSPLFGQKVVRQGGEWVPLDKPSQQLTPGSENRTRIALGLGPAVSAQRQMYQSEQWKPGSGEWGVNPLNKHPIAANMALSAENSERPQDKSILGMDKQAIAKTIGGQDYQDYDQAIKSWESAMLPIISGAAITPSEGQRQIRANLPQLGDTPRTLATKAMNRAMMTNAAADLAGKPRPFPQVGTWDFTGKGTSAPASSRAPAQGSGRPPLSAFQR